MQWSAAAARTAADDRESLIATKPIIIITCFCLLSRTNYHVKPHLHRDLYEFSAVVSTLIFPFPTFHKVSEVGSARLPDKSRTTCSTISLSDTWDTTTAEVMSPDQPQKSCNVVVKWSTCNQCDQPSKQFFLRPRILHCVTKKLHSQGKAATHLNLLRTLLHRILLQFHAVYDSQNIST